METSGYFKQTHSLDTTDNRGGVSGREHYGSGKSKWKCRLLDWLLWLNISSSARLILFSRFILCWTTGTVHTSPQEHLFFLLHLNRSGIALSHPISALLLPVLCPNPSLPVWVRVYVFKGQSPNFLTFPIFFKCIRVSFQKMLIFFLLVSGILIYWGYFSGY